MSSANDDATVTLSADVAVSSEVKVDPSFSGSWKSTSHENMIAFLQQKGFSLENATRASNAVVTQHIQHSRYLLKVTVNDSEQLYRISGGHYPPLPGSEAEREEKAHFAAREKAGGDEQETAEDLAAAILEKTVEWQVCPTTGGRRLFSSTGELETYRTISADGNTMTVEAVIITESGDNVSSKTIFKRIAESASTPAEV